MSNTVTQRTLFAGAHNVVQQVTIVSDGSEETDLVVFDRSAYDTVTTNGRLMRARASGSTCQLQLEWDQNTDAPIVTFDPAYSQKMDFTKFGGISNPGGTGATGDILLTTTNLDSGDVVTLILEIKLF